MLKKSTSLNPFKSIQWSKVPVLFKQTTVEFLEENGLFHGAALAYYSLFAMVPLLYLSITFFGQIIGQKTMLDIIKNVLTEKIGISDISGIMDFLNQMNFEKGNFVLEVVSIITLLVASSAFVIGLRQSINEFFDIVVKYDTTKKKLVNNIMVRLASLVFIGLMTVVIIVLYFAQTVFLNISSSFFSGDGIISTTLVSFLQHGFAIFGNVVIFTFVFKFVHDGEVKWRLAFRGALLTGTLLYLGQLLIKYYLFNYFFGANGGIAGTFFIILAWVYYSSQIIFYGAKFTAVYAKLIGHPIQFKK